MKQETFEIGHNAQHIINAQYRTTKQPLNLFFVVLESAENKMEIYSTKALQNKIIQIELPRVNKNNIIQSMRYQQYGHKNHTVTTRLCTFNVVDLITVKAIKKVRNTRKIAHCAEAIFLPTT